jgi:succinate-acetate transporter protein
MASTETTVVDPIADPGPLGLAGFAATTLVLSFVNAGLVDASVVAAVLPLALFYGGLGQLIAGLWDFRKGNTFGATAFCTYGGFWLAFAFYAWFFEPKAIAAGHGGTATGLFLLVFTVVTAYLTLASLRTSGALVAVFTFLTLTFLFLTIGALAGTKGITMIGGYLGIVTAILAFYASAAIVTNATWRRVVLPTFPLAPRPAAV